MDLLEILNQANKLGDPSAPSSERAVRNAGGAPISVSSGFPGRQLLRGHLELQRRQQIQSQQPSPTSVARFDRAPLELELELDPVPSDFDLGDEEAFFDDAIFDDDAESSAASSSGGSSSAASSWPVPLMSATSSATSSPKAAGAEKTAKPARQQPEAGKRTKKWKKPADKPCRPLSAYNLFFQSEREKIVEAKDYEIALAAGEDWAKAAPNAKSGKRAHRRSNGKIGFKALAQNIAARWKALDTYTRKPFEEKAAVEKERYRIELAAWEKKRTEQGLSTKCKSRAVHDDNEEEAPKKRRSGEIAESPAAGEKGPEAESPGKRARPDKVQAPHAETQLPLQKLLPRASSMTTGTGSLQHLTAKIDADIVEPQLLFQKPPQRPSSMTTGTGPFLKSIAKMDDARDAIGPIDLPDMRTMLVPRRHQPVQKPTTLPARPVIRRKTHVAVPDCRMSLHSMVLAQQMRELAARCLPPPPPPPPEPQQEQEPAPPLQPSQQPPPQIEVDPFQADLDAIFAPRDGDGLGSDFGVRLDDKDGLHDLDKSLESMVGALDVELGDFLTGVGSDEEILDI